MDASRVDEVFKSDKIYFGTVKPHILLGWGYSREQKKEIFRMKFFFFFLSVHFLYLKCRNPNFTESSKVRKSHQKVWPPSIQALKNILISMRKLEDHQMFKIIKTFIIWNKINKKKNDLQKRQLSFVDPKTFYS